MTRLHYVGYTLLTLVLAYSALWFTTAFELDDEIEAEAAALRALGHDVRVGDIEVGGFPYRISATISRVRLGMAGGGAELQSKRLTATTHIWTPGHWVYTMEDVSLNLGDRLLTLSGAGAAASLRETETDGTAVALEFQTGENANLRVNGTPADSAFLSLRYGGPKAVEQALYEATIFDFYGRIKTAAAAYETRGTVSGEALTSLSDTGLAAWRDGGGLVTFHQARIAHGEASFTFEGSISLDERLRPLGSFSGLVSNSDDLDALMDALGLSADGILLGQDGTLGMMIQNGKVLAEGTEVGRVRPVRN